MFSPAFSVRAYVQLLQNAFGRLVQGLTAKIGGRNKTLMILFICMCLCTDVHPQIYTFVCICLCTDVHPQMYTFIFICVTQL